MIRQSPTRARIPPFPPLSLIAPQGRGFVASCSIAFRIVCAVELSILRIMRAAFVAYSIVYVMHG